MHLAAFPIFKHTISITYHFFLLTFTFRIVASKLNTGSPACTHVAISWIHLSFFLYKSLCQLGSFKRHSSEFALINRNTRDRFMTRTWASQDLKSWVLLLKNSQWNNKAQYLVPCVHKLCLTACNSFDRRFSSGRLNCFALVVHFIRSCPSFSQLKTQNGSETSLSLQLEI